MILLDTSFLIALARPDDENHARAVEMALSLTHPSATTDLVFSEFISFLARKNGPQTAFEAGHNLLEGDVRMLCLAPDDLPPSLHLVRKFERLSFCDAASVVVMQKTGIKAIASFDSDFDRVPGIKRLF